MQTHSVFTRPSLSECGTYSVRESIDNPKYDKVIEVMLTGGKTSHIEVRNTQSMYQVKNGPFFLGSTQYVCEAGIFDSRQAAVLATLNLLRSKE